MCMSQESACTYCIHCPMMSQADACSYCMGSVVSISSQIYLYLQLLWLHTESILLRYLWQTSSMFECKFERERSAVAYKRSERRWERSRGANFVPMQLSKKITFVSAKVTPLMTFNDICKTIRLSQTLSKISLSVCEPSYDPTPSNFSALETNVRLGWKRSKSIVGN